MPKLNVECVRDTLLALESFDYDEQPNFEQIHQVESLQQYKEKELKYTLSQLQMSDYIDFSNLEADGDTYYYLRFNHLTPSGHDFLNNIRDDKVWKKLKILLAAAKTVSIPTIATLASQLILDLCSKT